MKVPTSKSMKHFETSLLSFPMSLIQYELSYVDLHQGLCLKKAHRVSTMLSRAVNITRDNLNCTQNIIHSNGRFGSAPLCISGSNSTEKNY
ncbi:hypothetical protein FKM82_020292 [Ascaphus truei]